MKIRIRNGIREIEIVDIERNFNKNTKLSEIFDECLMLLNKMDYRTRKARDKLKEKNGK